jgi:RES domain-containing protein
VKILVHLSVDAALLPPTYTLLRIFVPEEILVLPLDVSSHDAWKFDLMHTRRIGDAWLRSRESALACVPSSILPATSNYLLNPLHPDAPLITVVEAQKLAIDPRLVR